MNKLNLNECSKRKNEDTYIIVYAIKNEINIKKGEGIDKETIYTLVGVDKKGYRQFINIYLDRPNNTRYWLDCFENLKSKGTKKILFLSVDNNKNLKRTAKIAFPDIVFVDSITDIAPKFYKYTSDKDSKKIAGKIHKLYTQKTITEFKKQFEFFKSNYNNIIHQKLIEKYLSNVEAIYKYSINIRIMLFKYSANMLLYDKIRLAFNHNKVYINDLNEIYDKLGSIENFSGFTSFTKREWTLMLNDLMQIYNDIDFI